MIRAITGVALCVASLAEAVPIWALSIAAFIWAVVVVVHRHRKQEEQRAALSRLPRQHKRRPANDIAA